MIGVYPSFLSTWDLTDLQVKPVYRICKVSEAWIFQCLGQILIIQDRPKHANKSTDAPRGILVEGRYVIVMTMRLRGPAARCQTV